MNNFQRFSKPLFRAQSAVHRVSFLRALCFRCSPRVLEKRVSTPLQPFIMRLFHADFPAFRGRGPVEYSRLFLIYIFDPLFFHVSLLPPSVFEPNCKSKYMILGILFLFGRSCLILLVTFLTQFYHRLFTLFIFLSRQFLPFLPSPSLELDLSFPSLIPCANKNVCLVLGISRASLLNFYFKR